MEENKNTEIQDDETVKENIGNIETEEAVAENQQEETAKEATDEKQKRHKGRHAHEKELEKLLEMEKWLKAPLLM